MTKQMIIGAHTSAAGGSFNALYEGQKIGASTIQLFTSNQKQWHSRTIGEEEIALWEKARAETGMEKIMSHDSYLINLGSPDPELLKKSRHAFGEEIKRCHQLKIDFLNFHPGAATTGDEKDCLATIAESLLLFDTQLAKGKTKLLLETTAGQGTSVGHRFEQIQTILHDLHRKIPIGVCIDTCHIFVAGYDIRTREGWEATLKEFDEIIGLKHLYAFHINDSQKELGSRVDRHAPLGAGEIGIECFRYLMESAKTRDLPKYLETPDGSPSWTKEIALLRSFATR